MAPPDLRRAHGAGSIRGEVGGTRTIGARFVEDSAFDIERPRKRFAALGRTRGPVRQPDCGPDRQPVNSEKVVFLGALGFYRPRVYDNVALEREQRGTKVVGNAC
jgi:hypothetical protein